VNGASDQLFAGTRLTLDENRRLGGRNDSNALEDSFQLRTISNDLFEIVLKPDFVFQVSFCSARRCLASVICPYSKAFSTAMANLARYLRQNSISLWLKAFCSVCRGPKAEDTIPLQGQEATGFEPSGMAGSSCRPN